MDRVGEDEYTGTRARGGGGVFGLTPKQILNQNQMANCPDRRIRTLQEGGVDNDSRHQVLGEQGSCEHTTPRHKLPCDSRYPSPTI